MDRLGAMSVFVTAVEAGSLSAAGRKLGMPLPTVSRKISELESQLRTKLLIRSTKTLAMTSAGKSYLAACKRIIESVNEAERDVMGEYSAPTGELIIAAPIVFGRLHVVPIVAEFLKKYPDVDVQLVLVDRPIDLLENHIDVAVRVGKLPDSSLIAVRLGQIRNVVCASSGYLRERGTPATPQELVNHACINFTLAALMLPDVWTFRVGQSQIAMRVRARLVVNTAEAAIDAALCGVGVTRLLSYQAGKVVQSGALTTVLTKFEPAPMPINLVYPGQRLLPVKLRAFLDFATSRFRQRLRYDSLEQLTNVAREGSRK
jgi:DNA-binding transcriptional LysR family regulator